MVELPATPRVLVVRTDRLGDVLLTLPVLGALRHRLPAARLALLTSPAVEPLLQNHPWIDRLLVDDADQEHRGLGGVKRLARSLRRQAYDVALVVRPTWRSAATVAWAGVPLRVGTGYRAFSALFNRRVPLHRRLSGLHEAELNVRLAEAWAGALARLSPCVWVDPAWRLAARSLAGGVSGGTTVVLHPGSGGSAREWPLERFAAVGRRLVDGGLEVVVTGTAEEAERAQSLARASGGRSVAGETSLTVLAGLLAEASSVVAASTGPLHLAAAVGTPVVGLYPPIRDARAWRWRPLGAPAEVIEVDAPACRRCVGERCPVWDCMETIQPDQVIQAIGRLRRPG